MGRSALFSDGATPLRATIVKPGTFVHAPAFARHSMKATEEGPLSYLYVKDQTWTVVGVAANEKPPEKALSVEEISASGVPAKDWKVVTVT